MRLRNSLNTFGHLRSTYKKEIGKAARSLHEMQFWLFADALLADFPRPIKVGIYVVLFFSVAFEGTSLSSLSAKKRTKFALGSTKKS